MNFGSAVSSFACRVGYVPGNCPPGFVASLVVPAGGAGGCTRPSCTTIASASMAAALASTLPRQAE